MADIVSMIPTLQKKLNDSLSNLLKRPQPVRLEVGKLKPSDPGLTDGTLPALPTRLWRVWFWLCH